MDDITTAVAALGPGPLQDTLLRRCVDPLFSRVLGTNPGTIYLANHSLGRPLDRMQADLERYTAAWYDNLGGAWEEWLAEVGAFRANVGALINAPEPGCIVPKTSAGQGLRAVLNCFDRPIRVLTTRSEFDSIDFLLKSFAGRGRVELQWIAPRANRLYGEEDFIDGLGQKPDLVVFSLVFYDTGQWLQDAGAIVHAARGQGACVLVDLYHAAGALPVDVQSLDVDFAIGGSYKYLRGGPGAAWLYAHPRRLATMRTLDTGWFARPEPFNFTRPEEARVAAGGDGWLESTPAIAPFYQARAGLEFTRAIGVERLRAHSLALCARLQDLLAANGVETLHPGAPRGAFLAIRTPQAGDCVRRLEEAGVVCDARGDILRVCPDVLTKPQEIEDAARLISLALSAGSIWRGPLRTP